MEASLKEPAGIIFGCAILPQDNGEAREIFRLLRSHNIKMLDTARTYAGSEARIRALGAQNSFSITTKVAGFQEGKGTKKEVLKSAKESFEALGVDKVDLFLLHSPDPATPIEETMDAIQELYLQNRFNKFGLSNFSVAEVKACYNYASSKGYVLPSVYQSNYNIIARKNEETLFPLLRSLGISIQAYSPSAGGFLAKAPYQITSSGHFLTSGEGRWDIKKRIGKIYHHAYDKPKIMSFLYKFNILSEECEISRIGLAYRWVRYHSALRGENGDVMIIGAKNLEQLREALQELESGPLEDWIVERILKTVKSIPDADVDADNWATVRSMPDPPTDDVEPETLHDPEFDAAFEEVEKMFPFEFPM